MKLRHFFSILITMLVGLNLWAGGSGVGSMYTVVKYFDSQFVKSLLPPELVLSPHPEFDSEFGKSIHPIVFYFSKQERVSGEFKRFPTPPFLGSFSEFSISIPFVAHKNNPGHEYKYHHVIYLNSNRAIWASKIYRLKKIYMDLESDNLKFESSKKDKGLIAASFSKNDEQPDPIQDLFMSKLLKLDAIARNSDGIYYCSSITWKTIVPKVTKFDAEIFLAKGLTSAIEQDISFDSDDNLLPIESTFYVKDRWYLNQDKCDF